MRNQQCISKACYCFLGNISSAVYWGPGSFPPCRGQARAALSKGLLQSLGNPLPVTTTQASLPPAAFSSFSRVSRCGLSGAQRADFLVAFLMVCFLQDVFPSTSHSLCERELFCMLDLLAISRIYSLSSDTSVSFCSLVPALSLRHLVENSFIYWKG